MADDPNANIYAAIRKADAAGDKESVAKLAGYLKSKAPAPRAAAPPEPDLITRGMGAVADFGRGMASAADHTVGSIIPSLADQLIYAGSRAIGQSPDQATATAHSVSGPMQQPFGKLFDVTQSAGYQNEAVGRVSRAVGDKIGEGAKYVADKSGVPTADVVNIMGTLSAALPEAGGAISRRAAPTVAPVVEAAATRVRAAGQTATSVARNAAETTSASVRGLINAGQKGSEGPALTGGGAMDTGAANMRELIAAGLRRPVQLTKGQITRDPAQLRFENETQKTHAATVGKPLVDRQIQTNEDILANFDAYSSATGAETAGPGQLRPVGHVVDKALVEAANAKKLEVNRAYTAARAAGEMEEPASYIGLSNYIDQQTPTVRKKLAPILQSVREELRANDPHATGNISINALEDIRQAINKNTQQGTPNAVHARELKGLIDTATEGAGGDLYRTARQKRISYARQFENVGAIDKLLRRKPGTTDRAVAVEDVFDHVILKGSLDDTVAIGRLLKKSVRGQQAWKELQGQTIEHIKEQVTKSVATDPKGNPFPSPARLKGIIRELDSDGKLDYIFGKPGAQELRDLNATVQTAYTAPPGTVNFSNNAGAIIEALNKLGDSLLGKIPGVKPVVDHLGERSRTKKITRQVEDALYPNADVPDATGKAPRIAAPKMRRNSTPAANSNARDGRRTGDL